MSSETDQIPLVISDIKSGVSYNKGRYFGKGGFAKCYEVFRSTDMKTFAAKVISKNLIVKQNQKEKMTQEIKIHSSLKHPNVVGYYGFFEDYNNVYIVLELCKRRSMMELYKRRTVITEPETRFYMKQIVSGVQYLHDSNIIHRDLKLGNLFLNDELQVKIGDFGLATKIEYEGERKKTLCGTPNYIAPEILNKQGHSFEVDVWSLGCIMYTLMVGRPPFETASLKETYAKIKKCDYKFTIALSPRSKHMIMMMLQSEPSKRPKIGKLAIHDFLTTGYCPPSLPVSCLTMAPRFDQVDTVGSTHLGYPATSARGVLGERHVDNRMPQSQDTASAAGVPLVPQQFHSFCEKDNLEAIRNLIFKLVKSSPTLLQSVTEEMTYPAAQPTIWVSKWVDYSDKYGFGYQLSDDSVGVMFNDTTRLVILSNGKNVQYVDHHGAEEYMTIDDYPKLLEKKMKLLSYFNRYMMDHLVKTGAQVRKEDDSVSRQLYLHQWCRFTSGVLLQLNSGIVQFNFSDHTKIIMCPLMEAVTYIGEDKSFLTFRFTTLQERGCLTTLYQKIRYAYDKIGVLLK